GILARRVAMRLRGAHEGCHGESRRNHVEPTRLGHVADPLDGEKQALPQKPWFSSPIEKIVRQSNFTLPAQIPQNLPPVPPYGRHARPTRTPRLSLVSPSAGI